MIKILQQTAVLLSKHPGRTVKAALPGLIVFCSAYWMFQRTAWRSSIAYIPADGALSVLTLLGGCFCGLVVLGLFTQRAMLRTHTDNAHGPGGWVRASLLFLVQLLFLAALCLGISRAWRGLDLDTWLNIGAMALLPEAMPDAFPMFLLLATVLTWICLIPVIWLLFRLALTLPAAAMAHGISPWASWRQTRPCRGSLGWLSLWVCVVFGTASVIFKAMIIAPMVSSVPQTSGAAGLGSLFGAAASPQPFPVAAMAGGLVHVTLLALTFYCVTAALYTRIPSKTD